MNYSNALSSVFFAGVLTLGSFAFAGGKAPEKTHGFSAEQLHENELAAQIPAMEGYSLRMRRVTIEPGGATNEHSHANRPGLVFVEKGKVIEHRNGIKREFFKGDSWIETADTNHWAQNKSNKPASLIVIDLPKKK